MEPKLFVLGAGASVPVGYPTGPDLRRQMLDGLLRVDSPLRKVLNQKYPEAAIEEFRARLRRSGVKTIDQFLQHNLDHFDIGRLAIATEISLCEDGDKLADRTEHNWYPLLGDQVFKGATNVNTNQFAFVTFNYDRSLEEFLFSCVKNRFGLSDAKAAEITNRFTIIHMYGKIGRLPWEQLNGHEPTGDYARPYASGSPFDAICSSAECIRIPHDPSLIADQHAHLKLVMREYHQIHFIGFGYDELNLIRVLGRQHHPYLPEMRGTSLGLSDQAIARIENAYPIKLDRQRRSAHDYLRDFLGWE